MNFTLLACILFGLVCLWKLQLNGSPDYFNNGQFTQMIRNALKMLIFEMIYLKCYLNI